MCDLIVRVLGFDWILQLLSPNVHSGTVVFGLKLLMSLVGNQSLLQKFKDGTGAGGWLNGVESVVQNRAGVLLGFSVSATGGSVGSACDVNPEICNVPGFSVLQQLLPFHAHLSEIYYSMISVLVGQPIKELPEQLPVKYSCICKTSVI